MKTTPTARMGESTGAHCSEYYSEVVVEQMRSAAAAAPAAAAVWGGSKCEIYYPLRARAGHQDKVNVLAAVGAVGAARFPLPPAVPLAGLSVVVAADGIERAANSGAKTSAD